MEERTVDGLIFTTATEELPAGAGAAGPVVLLHRGLTNSPYDQVTTDNVQGGRLVANYLRGTGHRRIGYIAGPGLPSTSRDRARGFTERLGELGLPLDARLTVYGGFVHDTSRAAMRDLLKLPDAPTAVFCANDLTALGALNGAVSLGRRVPDDVWVVGYDDIAMAAWDSFDLTTVRQPTVDMSRAAVQLLLERIEDPELRHALPSARGRRSEVRGGRRRWPVANEPYPHPGCWRSPDVTTIDTALVSGAVRVTIEAEDPDAARRLAVAMQQDLRAIRPRTHAGAGKPPGTAYAMPPARK